MDATKTSGSSNNWSTADRGGPVAEKYGGYCKKYVPPPMSDDPEILGPVGCAHREGLGSSCLETPPP